MSKANVERKERMSKANVEVKVGGATEGIEKHIPMKLKVFMTTFTNKKTQEVSEPYVAAELIEPFPEYAEDFNNIRVTPRWNRDSSIFKFRMKRYLKTADDIVVEGYCEPVGYESKRPEDNGKMIYYPGMFFRLPYSGTLIEFGFKKKQNTDKEGKITFEDSGDSYIFRDLVSELWGDSYEPGVSGAADELADETPTNN